MPLSSTSQPPLAKRPRPTGNLGEAARTSTACVACRDRKIKCSGTHPCRYCFKKRLSCVFPENVKKRLYSVEYVRSLEEKAASGDSIEPTGCTSSGIPKSSGSSPIQGDGIESTGREAQYTTKLSDNFDPAQAMVHDPLISSSLHFGHHIKSLPAKSPGTTDDAMSLQNEPTTFVDDVYGVDILLSRITPHVVCWPSLAEAHLLLDKVLNSLGSLQHLFEPRSFADRLSLAYEGGSACINKQDFWYLEYLMVLALGELLLGKLRTNQVLPGMDYYLEAVDYLPNFTALRSRGVMAIEVLALMAFYLQCADRRSDAYLCTSMALRLAVSDGMNRETTTNNMMRSEMIHRNRLWWTIYMQERRLAAATGNPVAIQDDAIMIDLPINSPGFGSVSALSMNIKLSIITGHTINVVYGSKNRSTASYVRNVKKILSELLSLTHSIPPEYVLDFPKKPIPSRTSATLHLMLYQCIMLATRPTLLHLAKLRTATDPEESSNLDQSSLERLSETCIEAATRTIEILRAMIEQKLIANFGFSDLDATFSAAFVFVLVESMYPRAYSGSRIDTIKSALWILQHLVSQGNRAAGKRRSEIKQMCSHLGIQLNDNLARPESAQRTTGDSGQNKTGRDEPVQSIAERTQRHDARQDGAPPISNSTPEFDWDDIAATFFDHPQVSQPDRGAMSSNIMYANGVYDQSGFLLDDFALTGAVDTDWLELGRQLASTSDIWLSGQPGPPGP
ncbi:fungal-specific transcription factor domain-containing protein [Trichoderma velutinum]